MGKIRAEHSKAGEYYVSKHAFYAAYHYAMQYREWKEEYDALSDSLKGNGGMPCGGSMPGKPTERTGIKRAELSTKMDLIERTAREADEALARYILIGVTEENATYQALKRIYNIPCGQTMYYNRRRRFYWLLAKKLKI